jgi:hypothetical protein
MPSDTKRADSISVRYVWSFNPPKYAENIVSFFGVYRVDPENIAEI